MARKRRGVFPPAIRVGCLRRCASIVLEEWSPIRLWPVDRTRLTGPLAFAREFGQRPAKLGLGGRGDMKTSTNFVTATLAGLIVAKGAAAMAQQAGPGQSMQQQYDAANALDSCSGSAVALHHERAPRHC